MEWSGSSTIIKCGGWDDGKWGVEKGVHEE